MSLPLGMRLSAWALLECTDVPFLTLKYGSAAQLICGMLVAGRRTPWRLRQLRQDRGHSISGSWRLSKTGSSLRSDDGHIGRSSKRCRASRHQAQQPLCIEQRFSRVAASATAEAAGRAAPSSRRVTRPRKTHDTRVASRPHWMASGSAPDPRPQARGTELQKRQGD